MSLLAQFLLRLAFGLSVGMAITSSRQVTSGYFRNHLYVTLGLATLGALALAKLSIPAAWLAGAAAVLSFVGAAAWLYDAKTAGKVVLWLVAISALVAAIIGELTASPNGAVPTWRALAVISSGLVLGLTMAAMLLGHWYLNAPGMSLAPLRRLLIAASAAVLIQALLSAFGHAYAWGTTVEGSNDFLMFVILRWSFGLCGVLVLLGMAWRTLDIPNTQSATGILYVAVIGVFVGELAAALLSAHSAIPV